MEIKHMLGSEQYLSMSIWDNNVSIWLDDGVVCVIELKDLVDMVHALKAINQF